MTRCFHHLTPLLALALVAGFLASCETTPRGGNGRSGSTYGPNHPAIKSRNARIAQEPRGSYYVGRRWWTDGTRFWGYLRKPGQPWDTAKLVLMNESARHTPDRLSETPASGPAHGYDHNYEYRIYGSYTGQELYDPNSNLMLPEFRLTNYELISDSPGFLFQPGEVYSSKRLPPRIPPVPR